LKAIILASGRGTRMGSLTNDTPKPLLEVWGEPLIFYVLRSIPSEKIDEIIIVVNYLGDQIKKAVNEEFGELNIRYVKGSEKGNSYSFMATKRYLDDERFLLIYGDEIPGYDNVRRCLRKDLSILTFNGGTYDGVMVLNTDMFKYKPEDDQFKSLLDRFVEDHDVDLVEARNFLGGINTPEDLDRVGKKLPKIYV